jgi:hypothetical protein
VALSSLEVAAGSAVVSLFMMVGAWGRADEPKGWTRTSVGDPYRHQALEVKAPVPFPVRLAVPFAWAVVGMCALRALFLPLQILALEVERCGGNPETTRGPTFDVLSGGLQGVYLIATGAAIGAFARWARDAARDVNQARRLAPLVASGPLVVVALGVHPLLLLREEQLANGIVIHFGPDLMWLMSLVHVGVVLLGAAFIAVARRSVS